MRLLHSSPPRLFFLLALASQRATTDWRTAALDGGGGRLYAVPRLLLPQGRPPPPIVSVSLAALAAAERDLEQPLLPRPPATPLLLQASSTLQPQGLAWADGALWLATPTCILRLSVDGPAEVEVGDCAAVGAQPRDGRLRFARFVALAVDTLAAVVYPTVGAYLAVWDQGSRRVVVCTPWEAHALLPDHYRGVAATRSTNTTITTVGNDDDAPCGLSLALVVVVAEEEDERRKKMRLLLLIVRPGGATPLSCVDCTRASADPAAWAPVAPGVVVVVPPAHLGCGAFRSGVITATTTTTTTLWLLCLTGRGVLLRYRLEADDDAQQAVWWGEHAGFDRLLPHPTEGLWLVSLADERARPLSSLLLLSPTQQQQPTTTNTTTTTPGCGDACRLGEVLLLRGNNTNHHHHYYECAPAPPGGYAPTPLRFVRCPVGTHNPLRGAVHPDACVPCPPATFAAQEGAAHCAACSTEEPLQAPLRDGCLAQCPDHTRQDAAVCVACPLPGHVWRATEGACRPCPPSTTTATLGAPCAPCPPGTLLGPSSSSSSSACLPIATPARCFPTGTPHVSYDLRLAEPAALAVYTLPPVLPAGVQHLAAAQNGSLWAATPAGLFYRSVAAVTEWRRVQGAAPLLAAGLALTLDETRLYFFTSTSRDALQLLRLTDSEADFPRLEILLPLQLPPLPRAFASMSLQQQRMMHLCLAPPAPLLPLLPSAAEAEAAAAPRTQPQHGGEEWLFWLDPLTGALLSTVARLPLAIRVVYDEPAQPPLVLIAPDDPRTRGGLLALVLVVVLPPQYALFHLSPLDGTLRPLRSAPLPPAWTPVRWMRRWLVGGTLFAVRHHTLAWLRDDDDAGGAEALQTDEEEEAAAAAAGDDDGEWGAARLGPPLAPAAPPAVANDGSLTTASLLLLFVDSETNALRVVFHGGCECAPRRFAPFLQRLPPDGGALAAVCAPLDGAAQGGRCPPPPLEAGADNNARWRWWAAAAATTSRSSTDDPLLLLRCPLLADSAYGLRANQTGIAASADLQLLRPMTLQQASALFFASTTSTTTTTTTAADGGGAVVGDPALPLMARLLLLGELSSGGSSTDKEEERRLSTDWLLQPDRLGAFWRRTPTAYDGAVYDPDGVAERAAPSLRAPCASSSSNHQARGVDDDECLCDAGAWPLQLGGVGSWWERARAAAALGSNTTRIGPATVFVFDGPDGPPLWRASAPLLKNGSVCALTLTAALLLDHHYYYYYHIGWPATYRCVSLFHRWVYPTVEGAHPYGGCLPCAAGTFALDPLATTCEAPPTSGTISSITVPDCPAGAFLYELPGGGPPPHLMGCAPCPPGTFAEAPMTAGRCLPKRPRLLPCPPGFYLFDDGRRVAPSDACVECERCDAARGLLHIGAPYDACDGTTPLQPYACVSAAAFAPLPGYALTLRVRVAPSNNYYYYQQFVACHRPPSATTTAPAAAVWGTGPLLEACYFRCKYAVAPDGASAYAALLGLLVESLASAEEVYGGGGEGARALVPVDKWRAAAIASGDGNRFPLFAATAADWPAPALLLYGAARDAADRVCVACDPEAACPPGYLRASSGGTSSSSWWPRSGTEEEERLCGPPCLLTPWRCAVAPNDTTNPIMMSTLLGGGCIPLCQALAPPNAQAVQGPEGCAGWRCDDGWFARDAAATGCTRCTPFDAACPLGHRFIVARCTPAATLDEVCPPCPVYTDAVARAPESVEEEGGCAYACLTDAQRSFPNPFATTTALAENGPLPCLPCRAWPAGVVCPPGTYSTLIGAPKMGGVRCDLDPPCAPCPLPYNLIGGRALLAPTDDGVCRVRCRPGYHTVLSDNDGTVVVVVDGSSSSSSRQAYDPTQLACDPCEQRPQLPCARCPPGTAPPDCLPCASTTELGCAPGTYAPVCGGCLLQCPTALLRPPQDAPPLLLLLFHDDAAAAEGGGWQTRQFVPIAPPGPPPDSDYWDPPEHLYRGGCLTACLPRTSRRVPGHPDACVACALLAPLIPEGAPFRVYGAVWNATRGRRWWPAAYDPPHLPPRRTPTTTTTTMSFFFDHHHATGGEGEEEARAGLCWPCLRPEGTPTVEKEGEDPCAAANLLGTAVVVVTPTAHDAATAASGAAGLQMTLDEGIDPPPHPAAAKLLLVAHGGRRRLLLLRPTTDNTNTTHDEEEEGAEEEEEKEKECPPGTHPLSARLAAPSGRLLRWCAACPAQHACPGGRASPHPCPPFHLPSAKAARCECDPQLWRLCAPPRALAAAMDACPPHHYYYYHTALHIHRCAPCRSTTTTTTGEEEEQCRLRSSSPSAASVLVLLLAAAEEAAREGCSGGGPLVAAQPNTVPTRCGCVPGAQPMPAVASPSSSAASPLLLLPLPLQPLRCVPCPPGTRSPRLGIAPCRDALLLPAV